MPRRDSCVTGEIGPDYRRLMDLILSRIASGEYPTNSKIPSTAQWEGDGWSRDTVRTAITRLQADGILMGQPGKGVFVKATPAQVADGQQDVKALREQIAALQSEAAELRQRVGRIEADLAALYGQTGRRYPRRGSDDRAKAAAGGDRQ
jgi:DNA-binding GntR family transcriptional regulator